MRNFELKNSDITLSTTNEISQICAPLRLHFDVSNFSYVKILPNMTRVHLDTDPIWTEFFYRNIETYHNENLTESHHWQTGFTPLHALGDSCIPDALEHNIGEGIVLSKHLAGVTELFFITHKWKQYGNTKLDLLLRNVDLLETFSDYFRFAAKDIIVEAEKKAIVLPFLQKKDKPWKFPDTEDGKLRTHFKADLQQCWLNNKLTKREIDCIHYTSLDLSAKQVAVFLHISTKTVERHLENAKNKLNCRKKSSLIKLYTQTMGS